MLLAPGKWTGKGSFRPVDVASGTSFEVDFTLSEDDGALIEAALTAPGRDAVALTVWIVADDCGAYTLSVRGAGTAYDGTAKLDSEPNAGLLRGADGASAAFALFALRDGAYGLRGFAQDEHGMITWELALRPIAEAAIGGNVVAFQRGRRR